VFQIGLLGILLVERLLCFSEAASLSIVTGLVLSSIAIITIIVELSHDSGVITAIRRRNKGGVVGGVVRAVVLWSEVGNVVAFFS